jgi:hypothetical protein
MGFIGFAEDGFLREQLKARSRSVRWEPWNYIEADALWVNGAHAQPARNHLVRIPSADPQKAAVLLNLLEVDRPTAFTLPLASADIAARHVFDAHSAESVAQVLAAFETALRPLAAQLALAAEVVQRRHSLTASVYHLLRQGSLVAVVDSHSEVGILPGLSPSELHEAQWSSRPGSATAIPSHFRRITFAEMMWQYALRTDEDVLPAKYRTRTIYFRRAPAVDSRALKDVHLSLLSSLAAQPFTFAQLQTHLGCGNAQLAQALMALYFAGSITTDEKLADAEKLEAARRRAREAEAAQASTEPASFSEFGSIPPVPGLPEPAAGDTVPTPLGPH